MSGRVEQIGDATLYLGDCREIVPTLGADATVVYTDLGLSGGMLAGVVHAKDVGRVVEYRSLREWSDG